MDLEAVKLLGSLVKRTDAEVGLTEKDVEKAVTILTGR